jgi:cytochrome P450 family 97 subfamily B polypeptide 3
MQFVRLIVAESLRMYPEPPLLIRRALEDDVLPKGSGTFQPKIPRVSFFILQIATHYTHSHTFAVTVLHC